MKFKNFSFGKLVLAIIIAQSAGLFGSIFTFTAIDSWYKFLDKPSFAPPNWVFGPVWTTLYTLIGISLYLMWTNKKKIILKLFWVHMFLNAIWSLIFFGMKNLGLAFIVILIMDITLIFIIKSFYKINKIAGLILIPYLMWISFASVLNFSIWQLNKNNLDVYAQDFTFTKAREDYIFSEDNYKKALFDFNLKKAAYNKNPTLSLKEEFRLSSFDFINQRNVYIRNYVTMLRIKTLENNGLNNDQKNKIYEKLDKEVAWYDGRKNEYKDTDTIEQVLEKSKAEDTRFKNETLPTVYYTLSYNSLGDSIVIKEKHIKMYEKLKNEANSLVSLKRADESLFKRWFDDIEKELGLISQKEKDTITSIENVFSGDAYRRESAYEDSIEIISTVKSNLYKLNSFVMELENVIITKR